MRFKELGAELVASVKEGLEILSGKRDAARAQLPPDRPEVGKATNLDARRDSGADRE